MEVMAAVRPPVTGRVSTQARMMLRKSPQSTPLRDRTQPTNTMEPTLQWVVLIGMPTLEASSTVDAAPISMVKPLEQTARRSAHLEGVTLVRSSPRVWITLRPQSQSPRLMPAPPYRRM
ncbi:unnamed protein product [Ixodes pacificus]